MALARRRATFAKVLESYPTVEQESKDALIAIGQDFRIVNGSVVVDGKLLDRLAELNAMLSTAVADLYDAIDD